MAGPDHRSLLIGAGAEASPSDARHVRAAAYPKEALSSEDFFLRHPGGTLKGRVVRAAAADPQPVAVVNCGCYTSLAGVLAKAAPFYATRGYAYVMVWNDGPIEEVADRIFHRWAADAAAIADWLEEQAWCDGRVGAHGVSLLGSTAYALVECVAKRGGRLRVAAAVPALSFSRIHPTVFLWGHGLAAELVLRFLWLAEIGARDGALRGLRLAWEMLKFFGLKAFPGLREALERPVHDADEALWGRKNFLWRSGMEARADTDDFWRLGRDRQCDLRGLGPDCPPTLVVTAWWDIFLRQSLDDFRAAREARGGDGAHLLVYCGGHFGAAGRHGRDIAEETLAWYDRHLRGEGGGGPAVRLEVFGAEPPEFLELDAWPPQGRCLDLFVREPAAGGGDVAPCQVGYLGDRPGAASGATARLGYVYDPRDPTPYAGGGWLNARKDGPKDQRRLEKRRDLLVLTSAPFEHAFDMVGVVRATLHMGCSAPECDVLARLCIVRASAAWCRPRSAASAGTSMDLCEGIARTNFGEGGGEARVDLEVGAVCCRIRPGDRVRLHVCSAAHPKFLRHPLHHEEDWLCSSLGPPASLRLFADAARPSSLALPTRELPAPKAGSSSGGESPAGV